MGELSKAKLERPKRLGELASRWWGEISNASHVWERPALEVEQLESLTRGELAEFARQVMVAGHACGVRQQQPAVLAMHDSPALSPRSATLTCMWPHPCAVTPPTQVMGPSAERRRLVVMVEGAAERARAAAAAEPAGEAASAGPAGGEMEGVLAIDPNDLHAFKRTCRIFPVPSSALLTSVVLPAAAAAAANAEVDGGGAAAVGQEAKL